MPYTRNCVQCQKEYTCHPNRVATDEHNHFLCLDCMKEANARREARGQEPHPIRPGAYGAYERIDDVLGRWHFVGKRNTKQEK